ncbi:KDGP aldolase [Pseudogracilibacillus auburnensis]|uniref:Uncharacterized protein (TIGR03581 family) n=1 Tax=Pseudogracilibacillus auburnensis TaxID=1494959 RepID=A0A2V3W6S0_9BACI|nr:KDGP aldolase [Pseudogracilibacillus auburnensis]PXW87955.1 uncharacterized protein (TIGR03581 family) [Pseudogracilibacillus auburnensis]
MLHSRFYNNKICLNVLAKDINNAREIYEVTEGHVLIGLLSSDYKTVDQAVYEMAKYKKEVDGAISVGLGSGDPNQWEMVAHICKSLEVEHVNQVFSAIGYTRASVKNESAIINCLVNPTNELGYVNIATGPLSSTRPPVNVHLTSAITFIREMGGNSVKFFPMKGLKTKEAYKRVASICAKENFPLEPTGSINLQNFEEIVTIALEAGVNRVIPHVYSSIINPSTGKTDIEDVKKLYDMMKKVGK